MSASKPVLPETERSHSAALAMLNRFCKTVARVLKGEDATDVPEPLRRRLAPPEQLRREMEARIAANSERVELDLTTEEARRDARKHVVCV